MTLSDHVPLTITQDSVGVARAGFGVPLILGGSNTWPELLRFYTDLSGVITDWGSTGPEFRAARAMFSQSPHPARIAIARSTLLPTQRYTLTIAAVRHSHTYLIGVGDAVVEYASDSATTDGEIVLGLVAALNGVAGNNYIAAGATSPFTITADAPGDFVSIEVDPADITISQNHADPGVATDLAAIQLENDEWYAVTTLYNSPAYVGAVAAWIETQKKIYVFDVAEGSAVNVAIGAADDTLENMFDLNYARTMGAYHPSPGDMMSAAWLGKVLPLEPGSETWKYKTLAGVNAVTLTATQRTNLRARNGNSYESVAGVPITWEGTTADGDFLDSQRGLDWLEDDMAKSVFGALAGASKIPYTDPGIAVIESEVRGSLGRAVSKGIIAADPVPVVTVPLAADVSTTDKALRLLPDVKFTATLSGAIHKVNIVGVVSV